jgi:hypothetical protein
LIEGIKRIAHEQILSNLGRIRMITVGARR